MVLSYWHVNSSNFVDRFSQSQIDWLLFVCGIALVSLSVVVSCIDWLFSVSIRQLYCLDIGFAFSYVCVLWGWTTVNPRHFCDPFSLSPSSFYIVISFCHFILLHYIEYIPYVLTFWPVTPRISSQHIMYMPQFIWLMKQKFMVHWTVLLGVSEWVVS